ncbi:MAG TPA: glycoside hydrolase family 3 N-terminal domain-containing protein, partial [Actinopolymorphaceae bacterium]
MKLEDRVAALTLEDKVRLLTGADGWSMVALPQIGLRRLVMSDGPVGVRGERWDETDTSTNLPSPTAIAASWDERLVHRLGRLLAFEARRKNVDVLLAPTVNLHRSPLGGRHFECYSEDPLLTARIGTAYVRGLQSGGVGACVKHFVANDSETERLTYDARIDERALRELYLAPFEAIVRDGEAWSVMAAYNAVNGHTMTESAMLEEILKQDWGFDGVVVSDWSAARSTEGTANAGLDLAMPGPDGPWGDALLEAVRNGRVPEWRIDEKVRRLLRLASRVGALDGHDGIEPPELAPEDVTATVREAAAAGFVLARNHESLLPLDAEELRTVALLGPGADAARTQGGGSATVFPPYTVSPLEGLRSALGDRARVTHAVGAEASSMLPPISGDVTVRFLDAEGRVVAEQSKQTTRFLWLGSFGDDVPSDRVAAVEATVVLRPEHTGDQLLEICGVGSFTVEVAGRTVLDRTLRPDDESEPFLAIVKPPRTSTPVRLEAGSRVELRVRSTVSGPFAAFAVGHREPGRTEDEELEHAVALAAAADVAVV